MSRYSCIAVYREGRKNTKFKLIDVDTLEVIEKTREEVDEQILEEDNISNLMHNVKTGGISLKFNNKLADMPTYMSMKESCFESARKNIKKDNKEDIVWLDKDKCVLNARTVVAIKTGVYINYEGKQVGIGEFNSIMRGCNDKDIYKVIRRDMGLNSGHTSRTKKSDIEGLKHCTNEVIKDMEKITAEKLVAYERCERLTFESDTLDIARDAFRKLKNLRSIVFNGRSIKVSEGAFEGSHVKDIKFECTSIKAVRNAFSFAHELSKVEIHAKDNKLQAYCFDVVKLSELILDIDEVHRLSLSGLITEKLRFTSEIELDEKSFMNVMVDRLIFDNDVKIRAGKMIKLWFNGSVINFKGRILSDDSILVAGDNNLIYVSNEISADRIYVTSSNRLLVKTGEKHI